MSFSIINSIDIYLAFVVYTYTLNTCIYILYVIHNFKFFYIEFQSPGIVDPLKKN